MAFTLVQLLEYMQEQLRPEGLLAVVRDALGRKAGHEKIDHYLDRCRVRGTFRKLLPADHELDLFKLADCIYRLRIPLEYLVQTGPQPWHRFEPGSVVAVVMGMRPIRLPAGPQGVLNRAVGARDAQASAHLVGLLQGEYRLDFQLEFHHLPSDLRPAEAEDFLNELGRRGDVGAIVAIGSPLVNPLTDPLARRMFDDHRGRDLPARFRWRFDWPGPEPFLSERRHVAPEREGIGFPGVEETTYPRLGDDLVMERIRAGNGKHCFPDCGLLLLDCRGPGPFKVVCAGHGGCGTIASVLALRVQGQIARRLAGKAAPMPGRVFEVVWVKRRKRNPEGIDDLYFDDRFDDEWGFWDQ
jgi:hypothetical protein